MWVIDNNVATEITHFQKSMAALQNLAHSENLAPNAPLRIPPSFWNLAQESFLSAPPPLSLATRVHIMHYVVPLFLLFVFMHSI